jgi:hypothetical protein
MRAIQVLFVVLAFVPSLAFGQGTYAVDQDGCIVDQPCPWRDLRTNPSTTKTTTDLRSGNTYLTTRNPDGKIDLFGSNARTGSTWDQTIDPATNSQYGHNKRGQFWSAPLTTPGNYVDGYWNPAFDIPPTIVFERSEHDRWVAEWERTGGTMETRRAPQAAASPAPLGNAFDEEKFLQDYRAVQERRQHDAMIGFIKAQMNPALLVEAARAAARQQCMKIAVQTERDACLVAADRR